MEIHSRKTDGVVTTRLAACAGVLRRLSQRPRKPRRYL
jgi:hypothetical protein